jgi:hypothetical protein
MRLGERHPLDRAIEGAVKNLEEDQGVAGQRHLRIMVERRDFR